MTEAAAWRVVARGILLAFGILLLVFLIRELKSVVLQLLFAVLLAAAATPLVDALTTSERARRARFRPPRAVVTILVFLNVVLLFSLGAITIASAVGPDVQRLAVNLPTYMYQAEVRVNDLLQNPELMGRLPIGTELPQVQDLLRGASGIVAQAPQLVRVATGAFSGVFQLLFTLILALYLTADGERIRRYVIQLFPFDRQAQMLRVSEHVGKRLGAWARGQVVLGAIIGTMTWVAALAIGLPYAGALALIAGVGELIPTLGPIIAAVPFVAIGFLNSPTQGLLALGAAVLIQQLENNLIVPRVMGQAVELHPVVVMVAILAGNELLGVTGALLAVPVAASLSVVFDEIEQERLARREAEGLPSELPPALAERVARGPE
jgi:predicted PurR-regulated permease PerM